MWFNDRKCNVTISGQNIVVALDYDDLSKRILRRMNTARLKFISIRYMQEKYRFSTFFYLFIFFIRLRSGLTC